eukprot:CAMPEP_0184694520 /NCGR_PEP_ID=MMETSP0313-20130426/2442_1 /TAXON_ID=2792 /ORGANISM="Porphyridium aerugineum, Strain SAG 1380-2" /LENGTH=590 /DNA_ID=CAMNT_0027152815 /DNA_START=79 /DNA_END=1851 /DNA_ORIENTATION=-
MNSVGLNPSIWTGLARSYWSINANVNANVNANANGSNVWMRPFSTLVAAKRANVSSSQKLWSYIQASTLHSSSTTCKDETPAPSGGGCEVKLDPPKAATVSADVDIKVTQMDLNFDLVVLGSGPAGQKAAINSAKHGKKVAVIDKASWMGGVYVHTGTLPSKTFREAILHYTGLRERGFMSQYSRNNDYPLSIEDVMNRIHTVAEWQSQLVSHQLLRNQISIFNGLGRFVDPHNVEVVTDGLEDRRVLRGKNFLIAVGTTPVRPDNWAHLFDGKTIFDSDQILSDRWKLPRDMIVVGAGIIGIEYASMLNALPGTRCTVIDGRRELMEFLDDDIVGALTYVMRKRGATFKMGDSVVDIQVSKSERTGRDRVNVKLESGRKVFGDNLLYAVGRKGNTDFLNLQAAGIVPAKRGLLNVDAQLRTNVPHIYAAGDVIGFPALASTSMEQGREAANVMFGIRPPRGSNNMFTVLPFGIYTVPEISAVGATEKQLMKDKVPYEVGYAKYEELPKAHMLNSREGFLKLIFSVDEPHRLLGAAAIGEQSTEIIHVGQAVMSLQGSIEYFVDGVTNSPTFCELYRIAAMDGLNRCGGV